MNNLIIYSFTFIFSAIIGSFLNVIIYRLPIILKKQWRKDCLEFLAQAKEPETEKFNLAYPASHCPHCKTKVKFYFNIPIFGFLLSKFRCQSCLAKISWRYPSIELLTALLSCFTVWYSGLSLTALFSCIFIYILIVIFFIDSEHFIIPDELSFGLLWLGLILNTANYFTSPVNAIIGAATGYLILWLVMQGYRLITGKIGMGHGDFKLLAAIGAWLGWQMLPFVLLVAALTATIITLIRIFLSITTRDKALAFGPYLALSAIAVLFFGNTIYYLIGTY